MDSEKVMRKLRAMSEHRLLERNISRDKLAPGDWEAITDGAATTAFLNLEMRYKTYAEVSWCEDVIKASEQTASCRCEDCNLWHIRYVQMMQEVEDQTETHLFRTQGHKHG